MSKHTPQEVQISYTHRSCDYKVIPELRISGSWFSRLGFAVGKTVKITPRKGLLIIELVTDGDSRD